MNRCTNRPALAALLLLAALGCLSSLPVQAQSDASGQAALRVRPFPKAALRGEMVVLAPPEISLDGKADRLSPGARIRDMNDQLVLSGPLINQKFTVNYLRDNTGQVQQVWILNSEEARDKRPGMLETIVNFVTGTPAAPVDDGNTPYNQLPRYKQ